MIRFKSVAVGFVVLLTGFVGGMVVDQNNPLPHMMLHDDGHAAFVVANQKVEEVVLSVANRYGHLKPIMRIDSGRTHQTVLSDGQTVIMWMDPGITTPSGRMFVNNDPVQRQAAMRELRDGLAAQGCNDLKIQQPDPTLPNGSMFLATSQCAFPAAAFGFRPDNRHMMHLAPKEARLLK